MQLFAHGFSLRADLPIPDVFFAWGASLVMIASFVGLAVLWPTPRLQTVRWRSLGTFGRVMGSRAVEVAAGLVGVCGLLFVVATGWFGSPEGLENPSTLIVYIFVWVGAPLVSLLFGDVFRAVNPWRAVGRCVGLVVRQRHPPRPYPERWGQWPAAIGILIFTWTELVVRWAEMPFNVATCLALYSVFTWVGMARYGVEPWARNAETFGVLFGLFARTSIWETRAGALGVRPLLSGLPSAPTPPGFVAVVICSIGTVSFDGFSQTIGWQDGLEPLLSGLFGLFGLGDELASDLAGTVGLLAGPGLIAGLYAMGVSGAETVGGGYTAAQLKVSFAHTLVPIALAYIFAHYLTALMFQGQTLVALMSDPFDTGADLFGTTGNRIDYSVLSQLAIWYLQVGCVVAGHLGGLALAHDRALAMYSNAKQAVRSQYWMLTVMVAFTSLALYLLASVA